MPDRRAALTALLDLEGVAAAVDSARDACTALRWHEALRRRIPEAAAESRIRGAQANAALDGADLPVGVVRDFVRGARPWPDRPDPVEAVVRAAVQASVEVEALRSLVLRSPAQALARLHVAASAGLLPPDQVGRPRVGDEGCREFVDLGPAPPPDVVAVRLAELSAVVASAGAVPVPVVTAVVHAELCVVRPFVAGNGLVARAMERALVGAAGLDPTGVSVPEAGHLARGAAAYLGALAGYADGTPAGVALWVREAAWALEEGARQGRRICDGVLVGRIV